MFSPQRKCPASRVCNLSIGRKVLAGVLRVTTAGSADKPHSRRRQTNRTVVKQAVKFVKRAAGDVFWQRIVLCGDAGSNVSSLRSYICLVSFTPPTPPPPHPRLPPLETRLHRYCYKDLSVHPSSACCEDVLHFFVAENSIVCVVRFARCGGGAQKIVRGCECFVKRVCQCEVAPPRSPFSVYRGSSAVCSCQVYWSRFS